MRTCLLKPRGHYLAKSLIQISVACFKKGIAGEVIGYSIHPASAEVISHDLMPYTRLHLFTHIHALAQNYTIFIKAKNHTSAFPHAQELVLNICIGDGEKTRHDRRAILNSKFKVVGIATGPHPTYSSAVVCTLAGGFGEFTLGDLGEVPMRVGT